MFSIRFTNFVKEIVERTLFMQMTAALAVLWLVFSSAVFMAERGAEDSTINSIGDALYWGIAAFSTAGIADTPVSGISKLIGGIWIVVGSVMFFGIIVSTVTAYFLKPIQRPADRIIESVENGLDQIEELSIEELDLLRDTIDTLIEHVERIKARRSDE